MDFKDEKMTGVSLDSFRAFRCRQKRYSFNQASSSMADRDLPRTSASLGLFYRALFSSLPEGVCTPGALRLNSS